jgi:hypothetical protein
MPRPSCDQIEPTALRCSDVIRQGPSDSVWTREGRIGNTVECGDTAGARRNATRRAGVFCVVSSSEGLPVFSDTLLAPCFSSRHKIPPAQWFNLVTTWSHA